MKVKVNFPSSEVTQAIKSIKGYEAGKQKQVKNTIKKYAVLINSEAINLSPVDKGFLRASIRRRFYNNFLSADVGSGITDKPIEYAKYMEYGYSGGNTDAYSNLRHRRGPRKGKSTTFLRPAFDKYKDDLYKELAETVNAGRNKRRL